MTSSSTRLRMGAAVAITTLGLFSLGGSALAGEGKGAEHRNGRAHAAKADTSGETTDETGDTKNGAKNDTKEKPSPQEAKAAQFQEDKASYEAPESRHPSGKDRTEEPGGSGTQGQSTSDPDGDLNGGADKVGGRGGINTQDQDGNNGCGNDQDFEDDNNGWCGRKPRTKAAKDVTPPATPPAVVDGGNQKGCPKEGDLAAGETMPESCKEKNVERNEEEVEGETVTGGTVASGAVLGSQLQDATVAGAVETRVLGVTMERNAAAEAAPATGGTGTSVLGATFARGGVLARTGLGLTLVGLLGLALVLVGAGLQWAGRREHGPLA